jgi:hypothetical protein
MLRLLTILLLLASGAWADVAPTLTPTHFVYYTSTPTVSPTPRPGLKQKVKQHKIVSHRYSLLEFFDMFTSKAEAKVIASFPLSLDGSCLSCQAGITGMTPVQTPAFETGISCMGGGMNGPMSSTVYWTNQSLYNALTTTVTWGADFDIYWSYHHTYPGIFTGNTTGNAFLLQIYSATNNWRWYANGVDMYSPDTVVNATCYHIHQQYNGTTAYMTVNGVPEINQVTNAAWSGGSFYMGLGLPGGDGITGFIQNLIFDDLTPVPTPTPIPMAKFTPYASNPILRPTQTWEAGNTARISVIKDGSILRGAYWGGTYSSHPGGYICVATSSNGLSWTRVSSLPVLGGGHGGEANDAERPTLLKVGSEYRIYYQIGDTPTDIGLATSSDGSVFTAQGVVLAHDIAGPQWSSGWNSFGIYYDGSKYLITAQGNHDYLFSSVDGKTGFAYISNLTDLQQPGGNYNGRSFFAPGSGYINGMIQDFYCSNGGVSPAGIDDIYHALATDNTLKHYYLDLRPTVRLGDVTSTATIDEPTPDSLADDCLVEFNGQVFMYFTIADNTAFIHRLGVAVYPHTMSELFGGAAPTPTPSASHPTSLYLSKQLKLRE